MTSQAHHDVLPFEKSTNVRFTPPGPTWLRGAFSTAGRIAPGFTAAAAERLFYTTQRRRPHDEERAVLEEATAFRIGDMAAWSWGEGPTVLLVHGWNGRATQLGAFVPSLVKLGYRVVAFDLLGHGESPGKRMSLPEMADSIGEAAAAVGGVYGVIAHSMGGAGTTLALSEGLQIERAVFISPPSDPRVFLDIFSRTLGISEDVRERVQGRIEQRFGRLLHDMRADQLARDLRTPLLVIHDRDDKEVPFELGSAIAAAWPGAELVTTEGLGHKRILRDQTVNDFAVGFIDAPNRRVGVAA